MKKDEGQISMVDISRMAGVSVATVSWVINQRKVGEIIQKYNYVPNMAAKGLKTKKSNFIGIIVPDITNEFFARIILGIQNNLRTQGYLALVCNTDENEDIEGEYIAMLNVAQMAGMIFFSGHTKLAEKNLQALPAIYIDWQPERFDGNTLIIESDNYGGARIAVQKLYKEGCRNIACIHSSKSISTHKRRYEGCRDQLESYSIQPRKNSIFRWTK